MSFYTLVPTDSVEYAGFTLITFAVCDVFVIQSNDEWNIIY